MTGRGGHGIPIPVPQRLPFGLLVLVLLATAPAGPARAEPQRWVVVSGKSQVGFDASHPLGDFSGKSEAPTGEFEADIADLKKGVKGALKVAIASLKTGERTRDRDMQKTLDAEHHAEIRYTIQKAESSFPAVTDNTDVLLTIRGLLAIRGVDRVVTFLGRARLRDGQLWVRGETRLNMSEFGIAPPRRWFLQVNDSVLASFDLVLRKAE